MFKNPLWDFEAGVKYRIVSEDAEHYYIGKRRIAIAKSGINVGFVIGEIVHTKLTREEMK